VSLLLVWVMIFSMVPTGVIAASKPIKIVYSSWMVNGRTWIEEEIIRRFSEEHDDIEVEFLGIGGSGNHFDKVMTMIAAGKGPDVTALEIQRAGPQLEDVASDLTSFVERDDFDLTGLRAYDLIGISGIRRHGKLLGLPWGMGQIILYYNCVAFDEAGLLCPENDWTVDEFILDAVKLTKDVDGDGEIDIFGYHPTGFHVSPWPWVFGVRNWVDLEKSQVLFDQPEFLEALSFRAELEFAKGVVGGGFNTGKAGMHPDWGSGIRRILDGEWDVPRFGVVMNPRLERGDTPIIYAHVHPLIITKTTKHPDAAWEFMKFYYSEPADVLIGENFRYPNTVAGIRAMIDSPKLRQAGYNPKTILRPLLEQRVITLQYHLPQMAEILTRFNQSLPEIFRGEASPATKMKEIVPSLNALLEKETP